MTQPRHLFRPLLAAVAAAAALLAATPAVADCYYNGALYPTGTTLGDLVCRKDGSWGPAPKPGAPQPGAPPPQLAPQRAPAEPRSGVL
ncbi:hypothetical protein [Rhodobium gokarnense]|uniref:Uncharacterized protein n=1 Tax=Rhodobium gokarnense TaxID=364296 RepID=A0ABT3HGD1_9HYPH|nr:hypothetical protein [Rhodobium gokarnense]MCW2309331.1 hypothetical protein [Rhodobium gokarnense]